MKNNIDNFLNRRADSPTPILKADPFLHTKIAAISKDNSFKENQVKWMLNWSVASLVTSCAIIFGIFLGIGLFAEESFSSDLISEYSNVIYQSDYIENFDSVLEKEGEEE